MKINKFNIQTLSRDKNFSEILTGSVWASIAQVITAGLAMLTNIIIARMYGSEILGTVAILNSFLILATIFTVLGTSTSILRLIPEHIAKYSIVSAFNVYRKTQYLVAGVSIFSGIFFFILSGFIAEIVFSKPHLHYYFALAAGFITFKSLMLLNTKAVRGLRLIRTFAFMQMVPSLSKLIILVILTIFFFRQDNPIYAMYASIAVTAIAGAVIMDQKFKNEISSNPRSSQHVMSIKEILAVSVPMLMTNTMTFIIGQTGVIILGMFRPASEVGYYAMAVKMAHLTAFVLKAINSMAAPNFSALFHSGQIDELFRIAQKTTKMIFWTTMPILLVLIFIGESLLAVIFGAEFTVVYWAMVILVCGQFIKTTSGSVEGFMNMTGSQKAFRNIVMISAIINVILNLIFTPLYGFYGASIAAMISMSFWNLCSIIYIKKKYGRTFFYIPFLRK